MFEFQMKRFAQCLGLNQERALVRLGKTSQNQVEPRTRVEEVFWPFRFLKPCGQLHAAKGQIAPNCFSCSRYVVVFYFRFVRLASIFFLILDLLLLLF